MVEDGGDGDDGEVEVEDPAPRGFLRKGAADYGTRHRSDTPGARYDAEPLAADFEGHEVRDYDLGQSDEPTAAYPLEAAADEDDGKVVRDAGYDGADGEEGKRCVDEGFAAKDVGQGGEGWLEDGGAEEKGRPRPEGLDCRTFEF